MEDMNIAEMSVIVAALIVCVCVIIVQVASIWNEEDYFAKWAKDIF